MTEKDYRNKARENLVGNWGLSIGVAAVACLLGGLTAGNSFLPDFTKEWDLFHFSHPLYLLQALRVTLGFSSFLGLISFLIGGTVELGYAKYLLDQHDRKPLRANILFSQFHRFSLGFCQHFLRTLYTFLWSLLLVVPGIIASYRYALTPFLLAEHPDMTAGEAIRTSKTLMDGHKGDLFCLDLTFLGWALLCLLTMNLGHLALNPYHNAARAAFYREITAGRDTRNL